MKQLLLLTLSVLFLPLFAAAQESITEKTSGFEKYEGFFDYWWDEDEGKIWLEIDNLGEEFIYVNSMAAGVGSNDIGLDRSQLGNTRIVKFEKIGPKVLMVQPNYDYRATSENRLEQKSVEEAFAQSVLFGFEIAAREGDRLLIDITDFLMQDAHGVSSTLSRNNEGNFSVNASRSAIHLPGTFNFPKNSEFEAMLTFTGSGADSNLRSVTPSPDAVTVRLHHSFVELPEEGFKPREIDPRSGFFAVSFQDYSTPIGEEMTKRFAVRHRLEKKNPEARMSEPVEPIVYYLDNGTPEPVRTALLDGARWWDEAFEAAGYRNAFEVRMLPDDAHPLDIRYNVINWVHRSTRGWSYGSSVVDPRTGEIIKGNVLLGSLRVRQDYMIAEGLLSPYEEGVEPDPEMLEMALNRIRQLSAHEIGHTLGITHNFAANGNDLASVMDYPHPMVSITDTGTLSLENAYDDGIGEWDKRAVNWGYRDFPENVDEKAALNDIIGQTIEDGYLFLSDEVARPQGGSHPNAHLWDYGADAVSQLDHILDVREIALQNFGEKSIRSGRAVANLQDVLVPIYLFHRYQTEATVKLIGGVDFAYQLRGDGQNGPEIVDADSQNNALQALLKTLDAETLALPERLLDLIPPKPAGMSASRENFRGYTNPSLDPIAMAEVAADHTASLIFNPQRAARLSLQSARNSNYPGLHDVIHQVVHSTIMDEEKSGYTGSVQRAINTAVLRNFIQLAANNNNSPDVQSLTRTMLGHLQEKLSEKAAGDSDMTWKAHYNEASNMIERFLEGADSFSVPPAPYTPPGAPIGSGVMHADLLKCEF